VEAENRAFPSLLDQLHAAAVQLQDALHDHQAQPAVEFPAAALE
jgi:hypothetical protein